MVAATLNLDSDSDREVFSLMFTFNDYLLVKHYQVKNK